jgi:hypothetical protein
VLVVAHDITKILMEIKNQRRRFDDIALGRRKSGNFIFTVILQFNRHAPRYIDRGQQPRGVAPHWLPADRAHEGI